MTSLPPETSAPAETENPLPPADRLFKNGNYPAALERYVEILTGNPEVPISLLVKGALLVRLNQPQAAILYCDKHLELFPRDAEGWKFKSRLAAAGGMNREALTAIERALQLRPDDVELLLFQGYLLADIFQEYDRAIQCYDAALLLQPRNPAIWSKKGRALHNLDQFKKAIACYNKALRLDGKTAETWKDKGDSLNCLALGGKALACYRKAIRLEPERAAFWHIAALTHDDLGQSRKSLHCFQKVIEFGTPEDLELVNEAKIALNPEQE
jgi:tetratricopeptide (TPR) repeat protein